MGKLDVHYYDGKLKYIKTLMGNTCDTIKEKIVLFTHLIDQIKKTNNPYTIKAIAIVNQIMNDIHKPANFDKTNDLYADDILYLICKQDYSDLLLFLIEQLHDITCGLCPQGRTTRLIQVLISIPDSK